MNISIENKSPLGRRVTVSIDNHQLEENISSKLLELSNTASLKGFRPGKVPREMIERKFGPSVRAKALEDLISQHAFSVIEKENFKVAGQPSIEGVKELPNKAIEYILNFEIYPTIDLLDLSSVELEKWAVEISDEDVETAIAKFKENNVPDEALVKENVLEQMKQLLADAIHSDVQEKVLGILVDKYKVDLPLSLLEREKHIVLQENAQRKGSEPYSEEDLKDVVEKRVLLGLLVSEYIAKKELKVTQEAITQQLQKITRFYPKEHVQAIIKAYFSDKGMLASLERMVLLDQVVDSVLKEVKIVEVKRNFHDVV